MRTQRMDLADKVFKGNDVADKYRSNSGLNAISLLAKIEGSEDVLADVIAEYNGLNPIAHSRFISNYIAGNQSELGRIVLEELPEAVQDISKEIMPGYLLSGPKPKKFGQVSGEFYNKFETAYKANQTLRDEKALNEKAVNYKVDLMSKLKSPGMVLAVEKGVSIDSSLRNVKRALSAKIAPFIQSFEDGAINDARSYVRELVESLKDNEKFSEAVRLGLAGYEADQIRISQNS